MPLQPIATTTMPHRPPTNSPAGLATALPSRRTVLPPSSTFPSECYNRRNTTLSSDNRPLSTTTTDTSGYIATDDVRKTVILAFRGSYSARNWIADGEFPMTDSGLCNGCQAELGFWTSWTNVRPNVTQHLNDTMTANPGYNLVIAGHSLGAAVASLAAADLRGRGYPSATLYAFASPRVANPALAQFITNQGNNYRFTHTNDPVCKVPTLEMGYVHVSPEYWITAPNNDTHVTTKQVEVLPGLVNYNGNTGTGPPLLTDFPAHHWYFEHADACIGPGLPP